MEGINFPYDVPYSFCSLYYTFFTVGCCRSPQQPAELRPFLPGSSDSSLWRGALEIVILKDVSRETGLEASQETHLLHVSTTE